ncbi:hypothetical protein DH2020_029306 [Rehmannia glutinosa]|uniref:Reverse transcriptase zinc-binding domain-containing protein n=1 Tax=Rehmannia glutinosa TaxID=99300 RepID=A0ABR0VT16_REHGL
MAGICESDTRQILDLSQLARGTMPFRYLGIPLAAEKLKVVYYEELVGKIRTYVDGWSANTLSYAGRTELVRSVLQGVECFWLSILPIPAVVRSKIISICRSFLWGSVNPSVAWSTLCLPKSEGGLGLRDFQSWNHALLAKTLWNIQGNKDTLWYKWIHQVYLRGRNIWDWELRRDDSPLFKNLHSIRDIIVQKCGSQERAAQLLASWNANHRVKGPNNPYNFFRPHQPEVPWSNVIWSSCIMPKHSFHLWLCKQSRIRTRDRIRWMDVDKLCVFCGTKPETCQHLYFECAFTRAVWTGIRGWIGIDRQMTTFSSAIKWLKKEAKGTSWHSRGQKIAFATTVYQLWNARNRLIFEGEVSHIDLVIHKIKTHVYKVMFSLYPDVLVHFEKLAMGEN